MTDAFWKSIGYRIQLDVLFEQCFQTRKNPRESTLRIERIADHLVSVSLKPGVRNRDVSRIVFVRSEDPLDGRLLVVVSPLDQDPLVNFDLLDFNVSRNIVHLPCPRDVLAGF